VKKRFRETPKSVRLEIGSGEQQVREILQGMGSEPRRDLDGSVCVKRFVSQVQNPKSRRVFKRGRESMASRLSELIDVEFFKFSAARKNLL
jgi:hypothetical protein